MPNEDPCAFATDTQKKTTLHQKYSLSWLESHKKPGHNIIQ